MARKQQKKVDNWKEKKWYSIEAPSIFNNLIIGKTVSSDPSLLISRVIETTVGELTNDISKNNIKMRFKVIKVNGEKAESVFIGHTLTNDYLRSIVKRQTSKIDVILTIKTSDNYILTIKPTCFTSRRSCSSKIKGIRDVMTKVVVKKAVKSTFEDLINEIISGKLSASIYKQTKNIYSMRRVEIRKTEVLKIPIQSMNNNTNDNLLDKDNSII